MISPSGWVDWATRVPGPLTKGGYAGQKWGTKKGLVGHSMVGPYPAALARLNGPDEACWTFSNLKDAPLVQHYPVSWHTWASGSRYPNESFVSVEHEGGGPNPKDYREPLTQRQTSSLRRLIEELMQYTGRYTAERLGSEGPGDFVLVDHNECARWGSAPTACPSGRIPWDTILERLEGDDDMGMTPAELERIKRLERNLLSVAQDTAAWQAQAEAVVGKLARDIATDTDLAALQDLRGRIDATAKELAEAAAALGGEG